MSNKSTYYIIRVYSKTEPFVISCFLSVYLKVQSDYVCEGYA